jgi:ACS family 4-hydroxyphenylacetate permease-like MFS transporter
VILYLSYWIPHCYRARATALFILAQAMAQMIGNCFGGLILYSVDKYHFPGEPWQWLFLLEGLPSVVMGVVVLFYLTDKPADAKWLTADERERGVRLDLPAKGPRDEHEVGRRMKPEGTQ